MDRQDTAGEVFNVGGCAPVSMRELAELVIECADSPSRLSFVPYEAAYGRHFEDVKLRIPDTAKLEEWTGFVINRDLRKAIGAIVEAHPSRATTHA